MSNVTTGPGLRKEDTKKETVYGGSSPQPQQGTVYNGSAPVQNQGTVYNGPASGGTVYQGPGPAGTVYNPARQVTASKSQGSMSNTAAVKGAGIFYLIAAFTAINAVLILVGASVGLALGLTVSKIRFVDSPGTVIVLNVIAVAIFVLIGVFAQKGSKGAFLIGMLLYAGDAALLFVVGFTTLPVVSIVVHGIFLYSLFNAFRQLEN